MSQPKSPVRIAGLVRVMNLVRQHLKAGVAPEERSKIINWVNNTIAQVDLICRQHNISPDHLPKPSYLAYQFLQSINFRNIPQNQVAQNSSIGIKASPRKNARQDIQAKILSLAEKISIDKQGFSLQTAEMIKLINLIRSRLTRIEKTVNNKGGLIARLPSASLHDYQWLKYISDPNILLLHINALSTFLEEFRVYKIHLKTPAKNAPSLLIKPQFYNCSAIYQIRYHKEHTDLTLHEGFIGAPPTIYQALIKSIFSGKSKASASVIKAYANRSEFRKIALDMANTVPHDKSAAVGKYYDLYAVFDHINMEYFSEKLKSPKLTWNKRLTRRKFGHYVPSSNTIMISISLDDSSVPPYVIEFVMYHELLHSTIGLRVSGSKVYSHTSEFHSAERQFKYYKEAQGYLNSLAGYKH